MRVRPTLSATLLAGALSGCAGARYQVTADSARFPVSFSPVLLGPDGRPAYLGEDLEQVGTFRTDETEMGFFYSATGGTVDVSSIINREVAAKQGDGVVSLVVETDPCTSNWFFPLTLLPIYPGCETTIVSGSVVRYARKTPGRKP